MHFVGGVIALEYESLLTSRICSTNAMESGEREPRSDGAHAIFAEQLAIYRRVVDADHMSHRALFGRAQSTSNDGRSLSTTIGRISTGRKSQRFGSMSRNTIFRRARRVLRKWHWRRDSAPLSIFTPILTSSTERSVHLRDKNWRSSRR